jgi:hypothetical protein
MKYTATLMSVGTKSTLGAPRAEITVKSANQGSITLAAKKALMIEGKTKTLPHGESTFKIARPDGQILAYVEAQ